MEFLFGFLLFVVPIALISFFIIKLYIRAIKNKRDIVQKHRELQDLQIEKLKRDLDK